MRVYWNWWQKKYVSKIDLNRENNTNTDLFIFNNAKPAARKRVDII